MLEFAVAGSGLAAFEAKVEILQVGMPDTSHIRAYMVGTQLAVILQECYQLAGAEAALPLPAAAQRQPPKP